MARLVAVYDAAGGILGELRYVAGRLAGTAHCSLCDITHRRIRPKGEWVGLVARLATPLVVVHRNERADAVRAASAGQLPCVLAESGGRLVLLLGPGDLEACAGDVDDFAARLVAAARRGHLALG